MDFFLTNHAKKRMIERKIKLEEITDTINFPDYTITKDNKLNHIEKLIIIF